MATPQLMIDRDELRARGARASASMEQARAHMLESRAELRRRVEDSLEALDWEPAARKVKIRYWEAVRDGIGLLLAGPRGLVGALAALSRAVDDLTDRGNMVAERGRQMTDRIPRSRLDRRRRRMRACTWAIGAFSLGVLLGWVLGVRPRPSPYDPYDPYDEVVDGVPAPRFPEEVSHPDGDQSRTSSGEGPGEASASGDDGDGGEDQTGGSNENPA